MHPCELPEFPSLFWKKKKGKEENNLLQVIKANHVSGGNIILCNSSLQSEMDTIILSCTAK